MSEQQFLYTIYANDKNQRYHPGEVVRVGSAAKEKDLAAKPRRGESIIPHVHADQALQMVDLQTKELIDRPELDLPSPIKIKVGEHFWLRVPSGTRYRSQMTKWEETKDDKGIEFLLGTPQLIRLKLRAWPYREVKVVVEVVNVRG